MSLIDLNFQEMQLFVCVVNAGSITAAANHLELPKSTLSRRLKHLEECLGTRLLQRTTRRIQLTDAGTVFYKSCDQILEQVEAARTQIVSRQDAPVGKLSIYAPNEFSQYKLGALAGEFAKSYPGLRIEFVSGAGNPHMLEDNIDIMIHIDEPQDSSFIARKIASATTNYYASPAYLARKGTPKRPIDLYEHDCIVELTYERSPRPWLFGEQDSLAKLKINGKYNCDSIQLCRDLAEQGLGVTMVPDFICRDSLDKGTLVKLFDGDYEVAHNLYAMYPSRRFLPAKIRVFLDFLQQHFPDRL